VRIGPVEGAEHRGLGALARDREPRGRRFARDGAAADDVLEQRGERWGGSAGGGHGVVSGLRVS
jgi:hypothetical protein